MRYHEICKMRMRTEARHSRIQNCFQQQTGNRNIRAVMASAALLLCDISGLIPSILPITDQLKLRSDIGINYYYLPSEASTNRPRHGPWHGIGVAWGGEKKWWTWQNSFFQILLIDAYRKWHKNMFNVWPPMTRKCWYKEIVSSPLKKTLGVSTLWPYHNATYGGVDTGNIE